MAPSAGVSLSGLGVTPPAGPGQCLIKLRPADVNWTEPKQITSGKILHLRFSSDEEVAVRLENVITSDKVIAGTLFKGGFIRPICVKTDGGRGGLPPLVSPLTDEL